MRNDQEHIRIDRPTYGPDRFSPYAIIREGPISEETDVLAHFQTDLAGPLVPLGAERRRSPRFTAREHRLWVGWWICPEQFHTAAAYLENISQGGARARLLNPPAKDETVWLCLGVPSPTECARARVLDVALLPSGEYDVRFAFGIPCPDKFYRIAVLGAGG